MYNFDVKTNGRICLKAFSKLNNIETLEFSDLMYRNAVITWANMSIIFVVASSMKPCLRYLCEFANKVCLTNSSLYTIEMNRTKCQFDSISTFDEKVNFQEKH